MERIGIGITTHNRQNIFDETFKQIKLFTPNTKIVVVDDASTIPCKKATYRFETNVGIAQAKNKCLELLDDCEHIFLFDDDCFPTQKNWWQPYVDSREPHLMYVFQDFATGRKLNDTKVLYADDTLVGYSHPRGCMLYFDRKVLDVVGGYNVEFGRWGYEHGDLSNRIFNNHLTTFRFGDVPGSNVLFHSADEHETAPGTVTGQERQTLLKHNKILYDKQMMSKKYCPYKPQNNIVLTSYFVNHMDTQRKKKWVANHKDIQALTDSCVKNKQQIVVLHDCFDLPDTPFVTYVKVDTKINPYFQRWFTQYQYLRGHPEIDNVFVVDSTDVEMLHNPFDDFNNVMLYVGDEPTQVDNPWMRKHFNGLRKFIQEYATKPLLNCGVVGGTRNTIMGLCHDIMAAHFDDPKTTGQFEMGVFNQIVYTKYVHRVIHGRLVTTIFKQNETESDSWFRHK